MDSLKKLLLTILALATSALISAASYSVYIQAQLLKAPVEKVGANTHSLEIKTTDNDNNATSTTVYLTAGGATSTLTFLSEKATAIDYNISATASSSAANLLLTRQFSNDNIQWFAETCKTASSNTLVTFGQAPCTLTVPLATSTASSVGNTLSVNVPLDPVASKYTRLNMSVAGANAAVHIQAILKKPNAD